MGKGDLNPNFFHKEHTILLNYKEFGSDCS